MSKIGAIILAAGLSKRMGQPKLLLPLKGKPMFRYPLELAIRNQLDPICLIGGQHSKTFETEAADLLNVDYIWNPNYEEGMSTSLKMGIQHLKEETDAVFIFLADQPFVPDLVIQSMIEQYRNGIRIVRPVYQGDLGHPILIDKSLFKEFQNITGDQGGKEIIKKYKNQTRLLPFEDAFWGMDIDTLKDYQTGENYYKKITY
ncbi:NTP transferase domain-containing protein [Bacillus sp. OK048]|uniref:nucleotidyltransferase family protein n=1 Tax=Bacillus sp. OK048 TaxID=1882761 RepID=UPI00087FCE04|nr:nucleotidyltransferase family protein [Bacillus sp. OK048]SDL87943.1 molybdenum cofactor cytidylyltransferase [Bacillus sp. OK048]